jgi:hypothetical protein
LSAYHHRIFFNGVLLCGNLRIIRVEMMKQFFKLLTIAICGIVIGCVTTNTNNGPGGGYNSFYTPAHHLKKLITSKEFIEAAKVYRREREYFGRKPGKYQELMVTLATGLNELLYPEIREISDFIEGIDWPVHHSEWLDVRKFLKKSEDAYTDYYAEKILEDTGTRLESVDILKNTTISIKQRIELSAKDIFANYEICSSANFFDNYPVKIEPTEFLNTNTIVKRLKLRSSVELLKAYDIYKKDFNDNMSENFAALYYQTILREKCGDKKASFCNIYEAAKNTCKTNRV